MTTEPEYCWRCARRVEGDPAVCPHCGTDLRAARPAPLMSEIAGWFRSGTGESGAHKFLNGLVSLWTLLYLAVIVVPILSSNGNGAVGAVIGFGAAAVLFVPWVVVLIILVVLRSTTRSH